MGQILLIIIALLERVLHEGTDAATNRRYVLGDWHCVCSNGTQILFSGVNLFQRMAGEGSPSLPFRYFFSIWSILTLSAITVLFSLPLDWTV